jgi:hypothetical protein
MGSKQAMRSPGKGTSGEPVFLTMKAFLVGVAGKASDQMLGVSLTFWGFSSWYSFTSRPDILTAPSVSLRTELLTIGLVPIGIGLLADVDGTRTEVSHQWNDQSLL